MPKTIALQSGMSEVASMLRDKGYHVVDIYEAKRPGSKVDAYLYTSYHPDAFNSSLGILEYADISVGYTSISYDHHTSPVMMNITGMSPQQAVSTLEHRLGYKDRH